jgi:hypothetical protein
VKKKLTCSKKNCHVIISWSSCCYLSSAVHYIGEATGYYYGLPDRGTRLKELCISEIEVKGTSEPLNVITQPYAVLVPGQILLGTTERKPLQIVNNSLSSVEFEWTHIHEPHIIEVDPPSGSIEAKSIIECLICITGCSPGKLEANLQCNIERMEEPIFVPVESSIKGPQIVIQNPSIDFGLICIGDKSSSQLSIYNSSHLPARWRLRETDRDAEVLHNPCGSGQGRISWGV